MIQGYAPIIASIITGIVAIIVGLITRPKGDATEGFISAYDYKIFRLLLGIIIIGIIVVVGMLIYDKIISPRWTIEKQAAAQEQCSIQLRDPTNVSPRFYACVFAVHSYGNIRTLFGRQWDRQKAKDECYKVCLVPLHTLILG